MPCQDLLAGCGLPASRNSDETNDAAVRTALDYRELAEILVEGDEYSFLGARPRENDVVTRVLRPVSRPDNVMA